MAYIKPAFSFLCGPQVVIEFNWGLRDTHCLVLSAGTKPRKGKTTKEPHDGGHSVRADG